MPSGPLASFDTSENGCSGSDADHIDSVRTPQPDGLTSDRFQVRSAQMPRAESLRAPGRCAGSQTTQDWTPRRLPDDERRRLAQPPAVGAATERHY